MFERLFHTFVPLQNPLGFGAADFLELGLAVFLGVLALVSRPFLEPLAARVSKHTAWCMLLLAILPIALRLALLPHHPVPSPDVYDEFGHLLVADTLRHSRLANPPHPLHSFFETFFQLQQPAYGSIYPVGQGLTLALGRAIFGNPWAGVLLSTAAFCALCYWMLRAWTTPVWALLGGVLTVVEFGPLNQWMNSYWGGSLAAAAGCLVFGALPRLRERPNPRDAVWLGLGLAIHLLTRPYESIFLLAAAIIFLLPQSRQLLKPALITAACVTPALALTALHDKAMTGSFLILPYTLSQQQYGVPVSLTFQPPPVLSRDLTPQQESDYKMQLSYRPTGAETLTSYLLRLEYRIRYYRFFFLPPLYLALPFFFAALKQYRVVWVALTLALFALGANFYPFFYPHYIAAVACLFVLAAVIGLQRMNREAAWIILALCGAHFLFWYGIHVFDTTVIVRNTLPYETWDAINHRIPERRIAINRTLAAQPGQQLVLVRYSPQHIFQDEWVYNEADIDAARVVWARDLGDQKNEDLLHYYSGRKAWLLEPDVQPPRLTPYQPAPIEIPASVVPTPKAPPKPKQKSPFIEVR
jgi:hypothetical protein